MRWFSNQVGRLLPVLAISVLSTSGLALAQWNENGKPIADTPYLKSIEGFGANLVITSSPERLMADWEKPGKFVLIESTTVFHRGDVVGGFIMFAGCKTNTADKCQTTVDYEVQRPDGSTYYDPPAGELWREKEPPGEGEIQLGMMAVIIEIESEDPLGVYTIRAKVTDDMRDKSLDLVNTFSVVAGEGASPSEN